MKRSNTFIWLVVDSLSSLGSSVSYVLISFLIWDQGKSIPQILEFNLYIFVALLIGTQLSGIISIVISPKITYFIYVFLVAFTPLFIIDNINNVSGVLPYISILIGTYYAFVYNSRSVINQIVAKPDELVKLRSIIEIIKSVFSLISPIVVKYSIESLGFEKALWTLVYYFVISGALFIAVRLKRPRQKIYLFNFISGLRESKALRSIALIYFALGSVWAFGWGLLNIIILEQLGSLASWTNLSVIMAVLGIIVALLLKKVPTKNKAQARSYISFGAMIYSTIPLIMIFTFTREVFIVFILAKLLFDKTNNIITNSFLNKMQSEDIDYEEKKISYQMFTDMFAALGRIIPIAILVLLPTNLVTIKALIFTLAFVSFIPYLFSRSLWFKFKTFGTG